MKNKKTEGFLTSNEIDRMSNEISDFCRDIEMNRKEIIRLQLSIEEVMLRWQKAFGTEKVVQLLIQTSLGKLHLSLSLSGDAYNPLDTNLENEDAMVRHLMDNLTLSLRYNYQNGTNKITCDRQIKADNSFFIGLVIAIVAGIVCGFAGRIIPPGAAASVMEFLNPISEGIMGLIKMTTIPVIFLCTIRGIISTGGLATFGSLGKRTIRGYLLTMLCILVFSIFVSMIFFIGSEAGTVVGNGSKTDIFGIFFSIFPDNIVTPFLNGDNIKILFLAVLSGCALLFIGPRADRINDAIKVLADVSTTIMRWICKLMPVMVFIFIVRNIWDAETIKECATLWKLVLIIFVIYVVVILVELEIAAKKKGMRAGTVFKYMLPAVLKGTTACSSILCYTDMESILTEKLKTKEDFVNFSLPLGLAFFQVNMILLSSITMYFASISGQPLTLVWLLTLLLLCYISSIAAPPVSGGLVALIAMIFTAIGINDIYLGIASSLIMLLDYPNTGVRVTLIMLEIMRLSPEAEFKSNSDIELSGS